MKLFLFNFHFSSLPVYIRWVKYLSWLLHSTEALSIVQWANIQNICKYSTFFQNDAYLTS